MREVEAESFTTNLLVPSVVSRVAVMSAAVAGVVKVNKVMEVINVAARRVIASLTSNTLSFRGGGAL